MKILYVSKKSCSSNHELKLHKQTSQPISTPTASEPPKKIEASWGPVHLNLGTNACMIIQERENNYANFIYIQHCTTLFQWDSYSLLLS